MCPYLISSVLIFLKRFLINFEEERERKIDWSPSIHILTRDGISNLGMCFEWELNRQPFVHRTIEQHQPKLCLFLYSFHCNISTPWTLTSFHLEKKNEMQKECVTCPRATKEFGDKIGLILLIITSYICVIYNKPHALL